MLLYLAAMEAPAFKNLFLLEGQRVPAKGYNYPRYYILDKKRGKMMEFRQSGFTFKEDLLIVGTSNARGFVRPQVVLPGPTLHSNVHALSIPGATFVHARKALPLIPMLVRNVKIVVVIVGENDIRKGKRAWTIASHAVSLMKEIKALFPKTKVFLHGILPGLDLDRNKVSAASFLLKRAAKHCSEVFVESPNFPNTEWDKEDQKHLTASGLLRLWRNVESVIPISPKKQKVFLKKNKAGFIIFFEVA